MKGRGREGGRKEGRKEERKEGIRKEGIHSLSGKRKSLCVHWTLRMGQVERR
jgi:hypothetical protein